MPNHVYQKLRITNHENDDVIKKLKKKIINDENNLDFNLIIKQPDNIFTGNLSEEDRIEFAKKGIPNWYDWNIENWKTKWNAYGCEIIYDEDWCLSIKFQTAWSIPTPIIEKIIKTFKGCKIQYIAVDEGGYFANYLKVSEEGVRIEKDLNQNVDEFLFSLDNY